MPQGANSSFFTLIPKVSNPIHIKDFRPISLIGIHYKIIAKILADRLSKVIDKIVSKEQSAFIAGRQILDGPLILSEMYLDFVLLSLGFGSKWRSWIRACLHSSRASILINGSPTSEFSIKRGLRQGDPLSPILFILVMEGLHCAMSNAVSSGLIRGIKIGSSDITLSHLFYADDVIITTDWNSGDLDNIIRVLHVFYLASSLKINIYKSNIFGIGVPNSDLGLLIGSNMNLVSSWKFLIDRFHTKIASWKANLLSLEVLGGSQDSRKLAWIKWSNVLSSFDKGGLNIGSLKAFNISLLQKWRWRSFSSPNSLWVKVIKSLHGYECGLDTEGCKFNGKWASIVGSSNYLHSENIIPLNTLRFRVGCGIRVRFWKDIWIGDSPLYTRYNREDIGDMAIDGIFSVGDTRRLIDAKILPTLVPLTSWDKTLPHKVNIFIWRLALDRLPHRLNLSARGMDIASIACPSCNGNVESFSHIFFDCDFAKEI
ncbi:putative RNA-directed DNA polymerase, eukaryota, reverse transcriptase zinc-binding domain protein [Tanacetum coccineum]